jgi:glycosyltransferase involved in cell wall biosynthesis
MTPHAPHPEGSGGTGRRRILVVEHTGGIEIFRGKWEALARDPGIDLTLFAPESWIENGREVRASREGRGYRVRTGRVAWRGFENRGFFVTGLDRVLRETKPHVIHLMEDQFSLFALQTSLLARLLVPTARIVFYTSDNLFEGFRYPYRPGWAYGLIERLVQRLTHGALVSNRDARRILLSRGYAGPIRFVPFGLDPGRFRPDPGRAFRRERGLEGFVVGYVGRLLPVKGLATLAEAFGRLDRPATLLLVGSGPESDAIDRAARAGGWTERLVRIPSVGHDEVPRLMASLDALVLPSITLPKAREQFGRVLIEAMACEVPVVGSSSGAIPEVIGRAGLIFPEGDAAALAAVLRRLIDHPGEAARLGAAGRERVLRHFTWERVAEHFRAIDDALLRGNLAGEAEPAWFEGPA